MSAAPRLVILSIAAAAVAWLLPAAAIAAQPDYIVLQDGKTLAQQFDYRPDYRPHVVTFDAANVPSIRSRGASEDDTSFVQRLEGGSWVSHDMLAAIRAVFPDFAGTVHAGGYGSDRIDWDVDGNAYTVLTIRMDDDGGFQNLLLVSRDGCETWQVVPLPFGNDTPQIDPHDWGNVVCEHDGGRPLEGPPLIAVWRQLGPWKGQWASLNELYVIKPYWSGSTLRLQRPVLVSSSALTLLQCSGGASFAVTSGDRSFFVYATCVPKNEKSTPAYAATYYSETNSVGTSTLVARSYPSNDLHDTPGIVMDSGGVLHVVTGAHGKPFRYAHSTSPRSTARWSKAVDVLSSGLRSSSTDADGVGSQTYLSMIIAPDDVIHIVFRQGRRNVDRYFPGHQYDALAHQSLEPGGSWSEPDLVVVPPQWDYSQYYQKLTVDRLGRLFVSCSYFSRRDPPATRVFRRFHHRMVLISEDGGRDWRFATTADFLAGVAAPAEPGAGGADTP